MNIGGHIAVARHLSADSVVWLGAALPDVAAIGNFNLVGERPRGSLASGIALHHATDEAFHGHSWFRSHQSNLYESLTAAGIRRGPARAVAHVGPELLLDGELLRNDSVRDDVHAGMANIERRLDEIESLVPADRRVRWRQHLVSVSERPSPSYFADAAAVAQLLERILRRRPRLALNVSHVGVVGDLLAEVQPSIAADAAELVQDLATSLSGLAESNPA